MAVTKKVIHLPLGIPHAHHRNAEQQAEIRDARKFLKDHVRDDWDYPPLPQYQIPVNPARSRGQSIDVQSTAQEAAARASW